MIRSIADEMSQMALARLRLCEDLDRVQLFAANTSDYQYLRLAVRVREPPGVGAATKIPLLRFGNAVGECWFRVSAVSRARLKTS